MKHIKTFENIITDIFKSKYKKLPSVIDKLADKLVKFTMKNRDEDNIDEIFINKIKRKNPDDITILQMPVISIEVDTHDIFHPFRFISLYYNDETKLMMLAFISKIDYIDIKEFIISIIETNKYSQNIKKNIPDDRYFIEIDKVEELIKDINQNDFELFLQTKKYNL